MSKAKFAPEIKIHACEDFLSGKYTSAQICEKYGITYNEKNRSSTSLSEWMAKYRAVGPEAFSHSDHNKSYSSELKTQACGRIPFREGHDSGNYSQVRYFGHKSFQTVDFEV